MIRLVLALALVAPLQSVAAAVPSSGPLAVADHVGINATDADASADFYRRTFGMTDLPTKLPNTRWLSMGNGLALHIIGGRSLPVSPNRIVHLALRTADIAKTIAWFDANGIAWFDFTGKARTIQTRFDGVRQIFIQDPDGYWIEVGDALGTPHP